LDYFKEIYFFSLKGIFRTGAMVLSHEIKKIYFGIILTILFLQGESTYELFTSNKSPVFTERGHVLLNAIIF